MLALMGQRQSNGVFTRTVPSGSGRNVGRGTEVAQKTWAISVGSGLEADWRPVLNADAEAKQTLEAVAMASAGLGSG